MKNVFRLVVEQSAQRAKEEKEKTEREEQEKAAAKLAAAEQESGVVGSVSYVSSAAADTDQPDSLGAEIEKGM